MAKEKKVADRVRELLQGKDDAPKLEELVSGIVHCLGGPQHVSILIAEEIREAPPRSAQRRQYMEFLMKMVEKAADRVSPGDMSLMTDKDLERELQELIVGLDESYDDADEEEDDEPEASAPTAASHKVIKQPEPKLNLNVFE